MKQGADLAIEKMGREPLNPFGTCFDSAAHQMIAGENPPDNLRMCHGVGIANMPGQEGLPIGHAWLEFMHDGIKVAMDTTWGLVQPAEKYRKDLQLSHVVEYDLESFVRLWRANEYPGPWDLKIKAITDKGENYATGS